MLRSVVAHFWNLFVATAAVAAKHERLTRVIVVALVSRYRLLVVRRMVCADDDVRAHLGEEKDQKQRR